MMEWTLKLALKTAENLEMWRYEVEKMSEDFQTQTFAKLLFILEIRSLVVSLDFFMVLY